METSQSLSENTGETQHSQQFWNRLAYLEVLFILPEAILRGGRGGLQTTLSIEEHESYDKKLFTFCLQC